VGILSVLNFAGNDEVYKELWKRNSGISSLGWNSLITEDAITLLSKEEILSPFTIKIMINRDYKNGVCEDL